MVKKIDEKFRVEDPRLHSRSTSSESLNQSVNKKIKKALIIEDGKLVQNAAIVFASFKLSCKEWLDAILNVDMKILNASNIERLLAVLPEMDIMKKLSECSKEMISDMVEGERYLATFASVKGIVPRLNAIMLKSIWEERVAFIKRDIATIKTALDDINNSKRFKTLLNLVLFVGNYMNRKSATSTDTYAFRIKLLTKLSDVKGTDQNLLQTLTELMLFEFKGDKLSGEVFCIYQAQKIDLENVRSQFKTLTNNSKKTSDFINNCQMISDKDKFKQVMSSFVPAMKNDIEVVNSVS